MRFTKFSIVLGYALFTAAIGLYIAALFHVADTTQAIYYVANGCFMLLLSIWANVCS